MVFSIEGEFSFDPSEGKFTAEKIDPISGIRTSWVKDLFEGSVLRRDELPDRSSYRTARKFLALDTPAKESSATYRLVSKLDDNMRREVAGRFLLVDNEEEPEFLSVAFESEPGQPTNEAIRINYTDVGNLHEASVILDDGKKDLSDDEALELAKLLKFRKAGGAFSRWILDVENVVGTSEMTYVLNYGIPIVYEGKTFQIDVDDKVNGYKLTVDTEEDGFKVSFPELIDMDKFHELMSSTSSDWQNAKEVIPGDFKRVRNGAGEGT